MLGGAVPPRFNLGRESLLWQGFPLFEVAEDILAKFGETFLAELGGNAYSSPVMFAFLAAALANLTFEQPEPVDDVDDVLASVVASLGPGVQGSEQ